MPQISLVMQASNLDRPHTAKAALPPFISSSKEKQWGLVLSQHHAPGGPKTCCPKTLREILVSQMRLTGTGKGFVHTNRIYRSINRS
jgi:hypothetical protein